MYVYHCRLVASYNEREVVSLAVLADDNPRWRPDSFVYQRWGMEVEFRFPAVKLLDYAANGRIGGKRQPFRHADPGPPGHAGNPPGLAAAEGAEVQPGQRLRERGWDAEQVRQLFNLIDWLMELPKDLKIEFHEQVRRYKEENRMPFINTFEEIVQSRRHLKKFAFITYLIIIYFLN